MLLRQFWKWGQRPCNTTGKNTHRKEGCDNPRSVRFFSHLYCLFINGGVNEEWIWFFKIVFAIPNLISALTVTSELLFYVFIFFSVHTMGMSHPLLTFLHTNSTILGEKASVTGSMLWVYPQQHIMGVFRRIELISLRVSY